MKIIKNERRIKMTREQLKERLDKRFDVQFRGNSKIEFITCDKSIVVTYRLFAVSELDTLATENIVWNVTDCQIRMMEVKVGCEYNVLYVTFAVEKDFFDEDIPSIEEQARDYNSREHYLGEEE